MEQLAKNQLHTAEITGYTSDGAGVCHIAGRAVFVKGALAGETWQVRILKVTANAVYGKAEQCLSPAPARTQPPCPVYRTCGGCSLQHMDYDEQLRMKLQRVNDALTRIGGVSMPVQDIIGMEYPLCYRNKAIYAVGTKDGRVVKGFYRASSHDITPVEQCLLQLPLADKAAQAVCDWMDLRGVAPYDEATGRGTVRHLFTRCAMHTPDAVLCIVSARGFGAQTADLIAYLREHCPELTGIVLDVNKQKGNVVLAGDFYPLWGEPELTDRLCGLTFTLSPQAFYQVNPVQAERLYERAVEYAVNAPTDQVLDLYCEHRRVADKITTILPESSVVGMLLEHEERYEVVRSTQSGLWQHDGFSWQVRGEKFEHLPDLTEGGKLVDETIRTFILSLSPEQRVAFTDALFDILTCTDAGTLTDLKEGGLKTAAAMLKKYRTLDKPTRSALGSTLRLFMAAGAKTAASELNPVSLLLRHLPLQKLADDLDEP